MTFSSRLYFVRHASTASTRRCAFPVDEGLDPQGARAASDLSAALPAATVAFTSPSLRARQTAETAGLEADIDETLAECDFGSWAGLTLQEVDSKDPHGLQQWFDDPDAAPHGGESLTQMTRRVTRFLAKCADMTGTTVAVTHGGPVRAAVALALEAPPSSFWRIDASPCSITELSRRENGWVVARVNWRTAKWPR